MHEHMSLNFKLIIPPAVKLTFTVRVLCLSVLSPLLLPLIQSYSYPNFEHFHHSTQTPAEMFINLSKLNSRPTPAPRTGHDQEGKACLSVCFHSVHGNLRVSMIMQMPVITGVCSPADVSLWNRAVATLNSLSGQHLK